jgi:Zn-dependent protease with chaperone function
MGNPLDYFSAEEVERARRYHRPRYVLLLVNLAVGLGVLAAFAFSWPGDRLDDALQGLGWAGAAAVWAAVVVVVLEALRLPGAYWVGYLREHQYGFSRQSVWGWVGDQVKGLAVGLVLTVAMLTVFVALARAFPSAWPLVAAPALALAVLVLSFVAPVVLEPLFNRFDPLEDEELAARLRGVADRAGVPVRHVLVADASRRTTKHNAYVSGLGRTRRVVIYDTLLAAGRPRELELVVAHELGHRRMRHVLKGTLLGVAGAVFFVVFLWGVLQWAALPAPSDPRVVPVVLFFGAVLELPAMVLGSALSRSWERDADRFSLELTGDREVYRATHLDLARANLSDLDPPRLLYVLVFTHPSPPERLAAAGV